MEITGLDDGQPTQPTRPTQPTQLPAPSEVGLCGLCRLCRFALSWQLSGPELPPGFVSCLDSDWRRSGAGPDLGLGSPADVSRSPSSSPLRGVRRANYGSREPKLRIELPATFRIPNPAVAFRGQAL